MAELILNDSGWEVVRKSGRRDSDGNIRLRVLTSRLSLDVSRGDIPGFSAEIVNAHNLDIGRTAREDIWDNTGNYPFQTSTFIPVASSSNVNDTSAGTGAQSIQIRGVDATGAEILTSVNLNGTTEVTFPDSILNINEVLVTAVGSSDFNEGDITVFTQSGGTVVAKIIEQINGTLSSIRTVPTNQAYYVTSLFGSIVPTFEGTGLKEGELFFESTEPNIFKTLAPSAVGVFKTRFATTTAKTGTSNFFHVFTSAPRIGAGQRIKLQFIAHQNNTKVVAGYEILIEDLS